MVSFPPDGSGFTRGSSGDLLNEISHRVPSQQFETWFRNLPIRLESPNKVVITATNKFSRAWLERKFRGVITLSARAVFGFEPAISIVLRPEKREDSPGLVTKNWKDPPPSGVAPSTRISPEILDQRGGHKPEPGSLIPIPINRDFTFSNFVIGPCNRMAHAAALGVTEGVGRTYNPLFIYGGVGLGKTHLLHGIINRLKESTGLVAIYLTSEAFTNQFLASIDRGQVDNFRRSLRRANILIVDDIQFLSKRDATQVEFFHTFNALTAEARQIVLSSDCPPMEIPGLKERLISRFKMGLVTRIDPPCLETRKAIIRKKAHARGKEIPEPVVEYMAEHVVKNIRELEGALIRLFSLASLQEGTSREIFTLDLAKSALKEIAREENLNRSIALPEIMKAVALFYDVKINDLFSNRRNRTLSRARQVGIYLARELTHCSLQEIGEYVGGRNHATILYSINKIKKGVQTDPRLQSDLIYITNQIMTSRTVL